jgi:small subunit ribosomal protein S20e
MDSYTDKKGDKGQVEETENPTIRIILKSQEVKNLEYVTSNIITNAKEKQFKVKGPRFMPNKILKITTRKSPCGEGTNTYDKYEMRIHTRIVEIKCPPNAVSEITNFKIKPGVDINIKIWNN